MIDPHAARLLARMQSESKPMPADQAAWLKGYRQQLAALPRWQGPPAAVERIDREAMRLLRPASPGPWPTLMFIHGGGFVAGTLDAYEIPLRTLVHRSGWQVAMPDYRLAPEHPYPAAPDDCLAALRRLAASPDTARLAVAGDSAGGLLAVVTALAARDAGLALAAAIVLYPNADLREAGPYPSRTAFDGTVIRMAELYRSLDLYAGDADRASPSLSPIAAELSGLPPVLFLTNECDPLRDEGEALCAAMVRDGVAVTHARLPGMIHGVLQYAAIVPAGDALITDMAGFLRATA